MQQVTEFALDLAGTPWAALIVFASVLLSGFFPPLPSTSLVVALAAVTAEERWQGLSWLALAMALGSLLGDLALYRVAARTDLSQWRLLRGPRRQRALQASARYLDRAAPMALIGARFIPLARGASCLVAGSGAVEPRRFLVFSAGAAVVWALYCVAIGWASAAWFQLPLLVTVGLAIAASLVFGRVIGMIAERLLAGRGNDETGQQE